MIEEGHAVVRDCIRRARPGPYQLQAAIQAVHCNAVTFDSTDWPQIVELYDHLHRVMPSAVVGLNRAIAVAEAQGPDPALAMLDPLEVELDGYALFHAARGAFSRDLGRRAASAEAFGRAAGLATSRAHRRYFEQQRREVEAADPSVPPA